MSDTDDAPMDQLSAEYIEIRTQREVLKDDYEKEDAKLTARMDEISKAFLDLFNKTKTETMGTSNATIMRKVTKRYNPKNWDAVYDMILRHKAFGLLHKRVHDGNMQEFLQDHPDEYPAGLDVDSRYTVVVRRKQSN